ncbi:MAG: hypothetical protein AAGF47_05935, partial [Planctomycetota bacterium]
MTRTVPIVLSWPMPMIAAVIAAGCVAGCAVTDPVRTELPVSIDRDRPPADLIMTVTVYYADGDPADT